MCYSTKNESALQRVQLCKTVIPLSSFRASDQIQNTNTYQDVSETLYTGCQVCGRTADAIKEEKVELYMRNSTSRVEPDQVTRLGREDYENGLNAGSFLFLTPAVTRITTTAIGQQIELGTLPIY